MRILIAIRCSVLYFRINLMLNVVLNSHNVFFKLISYFNSDGVCRSSIIRRIYHSWFFIISFFLMKPTWNLIPCGKLTIRNIWTYSMHTDEEAKKAQRCRFADGWPSLINLSLFSIKTSNTKKWAHLSISLSIIRLSSLFAIFGKAKCASFVIFKTSFV
jgi:hypothetical protein